MSFSKKIEKAEVRVYDMTGKLIQEFQVQDTQKVSFFLNGENGVYTIEMTTNKGEVYRKRISKVD